MFYFLSAIFCFYGSGLSRLGILKIKLERGNQMRRIIVLVIVLSIFACIPTKQEMKKQFDVSEGKLLNINLKSGGSINIQGWDQEKALVDVEFIGCDPEDFDFEVYKTPMGIRVNSDYKQRVKNSNIRVSIKIPEKFDIKIKTSGGGICIQNIKGEINGRTGGGGLDMKNLTGEIHFTTGGGKVTIKDSQLNGRVSTGGGKVLVENVEGDIKASSGGGNVVYRNVKTPDKTYPKDVVYIRNAGGALNVEDAPAGVDISTGGGDIRIRSAKEYVKASTGGGDITVDEVYGWVKVSTGAGDIKITMIGDAKTGKRDVSISTGKGDVTLIVPENLSMDVDTELAYTKNSSQNYKIKSDFDLQIKETDEWDYKQGSPRKFINGRATIKGGKNLIKIRTCNGDVNLTRHK